MWGSDLTNLAPFLLKLLLVFIAFACFGFIPVFVVSALLKMAEHTCGLKRGIDRLLVNELQNVTDMAEISV